MLLARFTDPDTLDGVTRGESDPPGRAWRLGTGTALLLCGGLLVVSFVNSEGTDLRPGRYTDLATLVSTDAERYERLQDRAGDLQTEVERLSRDVDDRTAQRIRRRADAMRDPAGLEPVNGSGVTIVLSDAPREVFEDALNDPDADLRPFVVHQQDIQAVVNALWVGGAQAMTIQGQRVVTTTGIKCESSAVQLQGVPYPQPYTIQAVGDPTALAIALDADPYVQGFRDDADKPEVGVGWDFETEDSVEAPAYERPARDQLGDADPLAVAAVAVPLPLPVPVARAAGRRDVDPRRRRDRGLGGWHRRGRRVVGGEVVVGST